MDKLYQEYCRLWKIGDPYSDIPSKHLQTSHRCVTQELHSVTKSLLECQLGSLRFSQRINMLNVLNNMLEIYQCRTLKIANDAACNVGKLLVKEMTRLHELGGLNYYCMVAALPVDIYMDQGVAMTIMSSINQNGGSDYGKCIILQCRDYYILHFHIPLSMKENITLYDWLNAMTKEQTHELLLTDEFAIFKIACTEIDTLIYRSFEYLRSLDLLPKNEDVDLGDLYEKGEIEW